MTITNYDGRLEQIALYCETMLDNLAKLNNAYQDVSSDAYSISLPTDMIKFKGIKKIGGKTIVMSDTLLSAGVTTVVSKDRNNVTLQIYSVPAEVQALDGYGWSAGTAYNYIDFKRKVFVKNVNKILLDGTQNVPVTNYEASSNGVGWAYYASLTNNYHPNSNDVADIVSDRFTANSDNNMKASVGGYGIGLSKATNYGIVIRQSDTSLTNATAVNNYLSANPLPVYYRLATPIETDISTYLTDDNIIDVEAGGTLTFINNNGDDYQIAVPIEVEYIGLS